MSYEEEAPIHLPKSISSTHLLCHPQPIKVSTSKLSLGKTLFEKQEYTEARRIFEKCVDDFVEAKYYLAVMMYDGLGGEADHVGAFQLLVDLVEKPALIKDENLLRCAEYNIGRAYYEGFGVNQSDSEAEKWWLSSSNDGDSNGCVKAQCILGMFYSREHEDTYDVEKAHYWHQEATGNGSLESHAALGVMYEHGLAVKKDMKAAFKCFKSAADRGNIYAMGNLALHYYRMKMFTNAAEVAFRVGSLQDASQLSLQTNCLVLYIRKGISMGCFIYARCLERGIPKPDEQNEANEWFKKSAVYDQDTCHEMKEAVTHGQL